MNAIQKWILVLCGLGVVIVYFSTPLSMKHHDGYWLPEWVPGQGTRPLELMASKLLLVGILGGISFFLFKGDTAYKVVMALKKLAACMLFILKHRRVRATLITGGILGLLRGLGFHHMRSESQSAQGQSVILNWFWVIAIPVLLVWVVYIIVASLQRRIIEEEE